jgi:hypothetical protein
MKVQGIWDTIGMWKTGVDFTETNQSPEQNYLNEVTTLQVLKTWLNGNVSVYRVSVGTPEGKRLLGTPRCRWEDTIKIDLRQI